MSDYSLADWRDELDYRRDAGMAFIDRIPIDLFEDWLKRAERRAWWPNLWRKLTTRAPDLVIGDASTPYLKRWWIIPRNGLFNVYLHHMLRSDPDANLHDHEYFNISVILRGSYREIVPLNPRISAGLGLQEIKTRQAGDVIVRSASALHRLEVDSGQGCWSLFLTGPRIRTWGFATPSGWLPHDEYLGEARA